MSDRPSLDIPPMTCLGCGYILEGLPESRCPECGQPFSPGDPDTFSGGDLKRRVVQSAVARFVLACLLVFAFVLLTVLAVKMVKPFVHFFP